MEGRFVPQELAEVVRDLFLSERTGVLELVRSGGTSLSLEFGRGMIQYAEGDECEDLGKRLLGTGKASSGAIADVLSSGTAPRELGPALVQRGWMSQESLHEAYSDWLAITLGQPFRWEAGEYRFSEQEVAAGPVEPDVLQFVEIYFRAILGMTGFAPVMEALRSVSRPLVLKTTQPIPLDKLNLTPMQGYLLSRMDGAFPLADILSTLPSREDEPMCRFVYGLLLLGAATHDPPLAAGPFVTSWIQREQVRDQAREEEEIEFIKHRYESTTDASPYAVLGVLEGAGWAEVQAAYQARRSELSPQRFVGKVRDRMRAELRILEGRLVQAHLTLQSSIMPVRAAPSEAEQPAAIDFNMLSMRREVMKTEVKASQEDAERQAEAFFLKARKYFQQGDFYNCIQYCTLALKQCESVARFHHLMGEAQVRNPDHRWQKAAEQSFQRAVELDAWNADYWVTLGQFYRRQGLAMRARKQFEKALEIARNHPVALEELAALKG
jgi:tetratricopeptide (TPR) repeat protein